jgi:putative glutamine amidotransferase
LGADTDLFTLGAEYVDCLSGSDLIPVLLPGIQDVEGILDRLDGLVLSGGQDVHPSLYGLPEQAGQEYEAARDRAELALYHAALQRGMPILAICRGMQLIAAGEGVTLVQEVPRTTSHPGQDSPEQLMSLRHPITIGRGSRLAQIYGTTQRLVNTIHHQAVSAAPAGYEAVAWAEDGTIEAYERNDSAYVLAVQWHPEKMTLPGEASVEKALFDDFARACAGFMTTTPSPDRDKDSE